MISKEKKNDFLLFGASFIYMQNKDRWIQLSVFSWYYDTRKAVLLSFNSLSSMPRLYDTNKACVALKKPHSPSPVSYLYYCHKYYKKVFLNWIGMGIFQIWCFVQ